MRHVFKLTAAAAVAASLIAPPALAESSSGSAAAGVTLGPLVVQLTPLVAQQATWVDFNLAYDAATHNFSIVEAQAESLPGPIWGPVTGVAGPFEAQSEFDGSDRGSVAAWVTSTGVAEGASFSALGGVDSGEYGYSWFMGGVNGSYTGYGAWFSLSPQTELVISAQAALQASATGGSEAGVSDSNAYAHAWISFTGPSAYGGGGSQSDLDFVSLAGSSYYGGSPFDQTLDQPLLVRFVNGTDTAMDARFEFAVYIAGMANPVPEPATWALMLGGLATWAALRRRP